MHNEREASSSSSIAPPPPLPSWADLPAEITANILLRLETIEILESAQRVCTSWWKVCHDPAMWRVVDLKYNIFSSIRDRVLEKICKIAVDRSQGQLLKISIVNFGSTDLLNYIAQSKYVDEAGIFYCCRVQNETLLMLCWEERKRRGTVKRDERRKSLVKQQREDCANQSFDSESESWRQSHALSSTILEEQLIAVRCTKLRYARIRGRAVPQGSIVHSLTLHFCKRLNPWLESVTS
ncbi:hypothetical protein RND71_004811 [Anisodus tanguticus]|uniref:F-box domain-containing protein n=1 Tax=Anisodus tanguticus TaxID=243964 RepID=A0AAE1SQN3_9SOLA|nr:hypothetical protein RND71_004811 [Anisodus tanguticus]